MNESKKQIDIIISAVVAILLAHAINRLLDKILSGQDTKMLILWILFLSVLFYIFVKQWYDKDDKDDKEDKEDKRVKE